MVVDKYEQYFKDHNRTKEFSGHSAKVKLKLVYPQHP